MSIRKRDRDRTSQGTNPTQKQRTTLTKTSGYLDSLRVDQEERQRQNKQGNKSYTKTLHSSYLDSLCVDQEESHALEEDVKEEGGMTEEGVD